MRPEDVFRVKKDLIGDGIKSIAKRIEIFLVDSFLYQRLKHVKSWPFYLEISDHNAIVLEWKDELGEVKIPFMFNLNSVKEPDF